MSCQSPWIYTKADSQDVGKKGDEAKIRSTVTQQDTAPGHSILSWRVENGPDPQHCPTLEKHAFTHRKCALSWLLGGATQPMKPIITRGGRCLEGASRHFPACSGTNKSDRVKDAGAIPPTSVPRTGSFSVCPSYPTVKRGYNCTSAPLFPRYKALRELALSPYYLSFLPHQGTFTFLLACIFSTTDSAPFKSKPMTILL